MNEARNNFVDKLQIFKGVHTYTDIFNIYTNQRALTNGFFKLS